MAGCPEFEGCVNRRISDAEFRGMVIAKLENIEKNQSTMQKSINFFYVKVGGISASASLMVIVISKALG